MGEFRVIIVDDIFTNRLLLSEILISMGYKFYLAKNGAEAIEELKTNEYDLIFMDIEMPVMNGIEATSYIRNMMQEPKCDIPIVALTAHNPRLFFDDHSEVGFTGLLTKPYSLKKIKDILSELFPAQIKQ